jgi:pyruvate/2-oxoglutarate dehydrogenase complex dihydrolipoamide acyltransferase (E2) component
VRPFGHVLLIVLFYRLQDADKKGLGTITDDVKSLAGKARSNTLKPNDYEVC